jgi:predicted secreted Zn-dependent protease
MTGLRAFLATLVAVAVFAPVIASAEEPTEDPAALAAIYDKQAADFRAGAEKHAKIARMHRAGAGSSKMAHDSIAQHCERIAESLTAAAKESEALAESYRGLVKK